MIRMISSSIKTIQKEWGIPNKHAGLYDGWRSGGYSSFLQFYQWRAEKLWNSVGKVSWVFLKKRNIIFERAKFNLRRQQEGESVDDFITSLHSLSEYCNYGQLRDEMIQDWIVVELCDCAVSEKLQLESELILEKAITLACNKESIRNQQPVVRADTSSSVDAVGFSSKPRSSTKTQKSQKPKSASNSKCSRCGKLNHQDKEQCPAKNAMCRKC